jgi:hypothetical protein
MERISATNFHGFSDDFPSDSTFNNNQADIASVPDFGVRVKN